MTISPDIRPEQKYSNVTEGDFHQRPEETQSQSVAARVIWIALLVVIGLAGVYLLALLFSAAVGIVANDSTTESVPVEQTQSAPATTPTPAD